MANVTLEDSNTNFATKCVVHGHLSRIFRCKILNEAYFVTAGEDSVINIWDYHGKLCRKFDAHQGSPVWCLEFDRNDNYIISGGSDGGIVAFPYAVGFNSSKLNLPNDETPKKVALLESGWIVCLSERGVLYTYDISAEKWMAVQEYCNLKSYALMEVSKCRRRIALAGIFSY